MILQTVKLIGLIYCDEPDIIQINIDGQDHNPLTNLGTHTVLEQDLSITVSIARIFDCLTAIKQELICESN